jgi:hypothetical protein
VPAYKREMTHVQGPWVAHLAAPSGELS